MKGLKAIISAVLTAAMLAAICSSGVVGVSAKKKSSVIFDINGDNVSDEKDIAEAKKYASSIVRAGEKSGEDLGLFPSQVIYGDISLTDYDTGQADAVPRYSLTNLNLSTTPKNQCAIGSCWAFAAIGALESATLKAEERLVNPQNKIDSKAFGEPVLSGLKDKYDFSEKSVPWFMGEPVKAGEDSSQAGEGFSFGEKSMERYDFGGPASYPETLFTSWRGIYSESTVPFVPKDWNGTLRELYDTTTKDWTLPGLSAKSAANIPRVKDYLLLPLTSKYSYNLETGEKKWEGNEKKARSIIKQAILEYGGVGICYNHNQNSDNFSFFHSGEVARPSHVSVIVGWDDNYSKENFTNKTSSAPFEDGAWLVKNSWGSYDYMKSSFKNWDKDREGIRGMTYEESKEYAKSKNTTLERLQKDKRSVNKYIYEWGLRDSEDRGTGYFWLYYGDNSINANYVYNVDTASDGYDYDNNYQYDYAMCSDDLRFSFRTADKDTLVGNVFTANGNEKLKAFSAYTNESDAVVKTDIYLLTGSERNPAQGKLAASLENKIKFAGFHTIELNNEISLLKGQKFAIVQNITSYDKTTGAEVSYLNLETDFRGEKISGNYSVDNNIVCNDGETFVRLDGSWTTPGELGDSLVVGEIFKFGNAKIKAFTVNTHTAETKKPVVKKKANPLKVSAKSKTVKAKSLRKRARKLKALTIKNAKGKVSCKITSAPGKIKKLMKINSKGVISIKKWKKAKKGTYKIKVKITAAGNSGYNSGSVTKTVKLKIK